MKNTMIILLTALFAVGCKTDTKDSSDIDATISETDARAAYWAAVCPRNLECYSEKALKAYGWVSVDDCIATWEKAADNDMDGDGTLDEDCPQADFDDCLTAIQEATCDEISNGAFAMSCMFQCD